MTKEELKKEAREYLAEHSEYSEVFGQTFVAVDTLTAMLDFAKRETKELEAQIEKMKCCENCIHHYIALDDTTSCKLLDRLASSKPCDKWEIKEK